MFEGGLKKHRPLESNFELQITALIDTLVIILIFLLKSIATDTLEMEQPKNLRLPGLMDGVTSGAGDRLVFRTDGISWNSSSIMSFDNLNNVPKDGNAAWHLLESAIAASETDEKAKSKFDGKLLLQADKSIPFTVLTQALRIAKAHGYRDIRFVGAKYN